MCVCVCVGGGGGAGVAYKRKFMVFALKRLSTVSSKNKERKHKRGSWRRTLARIKRDRMNVLKTPHFWKIQTIRRLSRDGRTRHNSIVDETGSYFSTMYIVYFIINIFETWTVFPLFSLIFIRLCIGQIEASTCPPPRAYPGHLTPLPSRGGGNLIIRVFQGVGNLNCTFDFM